MKKSLLSLSMMTMLLVFSCTNDVENFDVTKGQSEPLAEVVQTDNIPKELLNIKSYINNRFSGADTRTLQNISVDPYVIDSDTALYIANYDNGWEVFSTDQRTPFVMLSSDTGHFDINDNNLPTALKAYVHSVADEIHQLKQVENNDNTKDPEWLIYYSPIEGSEPYNGKEIKGNRDPGEPEPGEGHWELIYSNLLSDSIVAQSPKYTSTQWNQPTPFNAYIPYAQDAPYVLGPAGCTPVATAQYLYFMHGKYGQPQKAVITATLTNATTHMYSFSNKSAGAWSQMALYDNGSPYNLARTAIFIAYVGQMIGTSYYSDRATASLSNACTLVSSESGISHSYDNYSYSYVIDQLLNKQAAVLMSAVDATANVGHSFIVDKIITRDKVYKDYYGWVGTTSTGQNANYIDENGHIVGYMIHKQEIRHQTAYSYNMNWGWGGYCDNVECSPYSNNDWQAGGYYDNSNVYHDYHWNSTRKMAKKNVNY